jgi:hypothetical protein
MINVSTKKMGIWYCFIRDFIIVSPFLILVTVCQLSVVWADSASDLLWRLECHQQKPPIQH